MKASDETRKRISNSTSGEKSHNYGKPMPEITRQKISISKQGNVPWNKGIPRDEKTKKKISDAKKGRPATIETRQKQSKAHKGNDVRAKNWKITNPNGEIEIIKNLNKYCKDNNLDKRTMLKVASGIYSHHKKHKCERL